MYTHPYSLKTYKIPGPFAWSSPNYVRHLIYDDTRIRTLNHLSDEKAKDFVHLLNCAYSEGYNRAKND